MDPDIPQFMDSLDGSDANDILWSFSSSKCGTLSSRGTHIKGIPHSEYHENDTMIHYHSFEDKVETVFVFEENFSIDHRESVDDDFTYEKCCLEHIEELSSKKSHSSEDDIFHRNYNHGDHNYNHGENQVEEFFNQNLMNRNENCLVYIGDDLLGYTRSESDINIDYRSSEDNDDPLPEGYFDMPSVDDSHVLRLVNLCVAQSSTDKVRKYPSLGALQHYAETSNSLDSSLPYLHASTKSNNLLNLAAVNHLHDNDDLSSRLFDEPPNSFCANKQNLSSELINPVSGTNLQFEINHEFNGGEIMDCIQSSVITGDYSLITHGKLDPDYSCDEVVKQDSVDILLLNLEAVVQRPINAEDRSDKKEINISYQNEVVDIVDQVTDDAEQFEKKIFYDSPICLKQPRSSHLIELVNRLIDVVSDPLQPLDETVRKVTFYIEKNSDMSVIGQDDRNETAEVCYNVDVEREEVVGLGSLNSYVTLGLSKDQPHCIPHVINKKMTKMLPMDSENEVKKKINRNEPEAKTRVKDSTPAYERLYALGKKKLRERPSSPELKRVLSPKNIKDKSPVAPTPNVKRSASLSPIKTKVPN